jgi:tryptophanyl-tRNA synthetase
MRNSNGVKPILFSGIQPTGDIHIGNYLGALRNWVALQSKYQSIFSIVDYHALTTSTNPDDLRKRSFQAAVDLLSIGVDPKKSILFRQSDVPEHTELQWIFSCITPVPELERMTQYKDLVQRHTKTANSGMLMYPVLQAADILLYHATHVPVGEDQVQHLELSRIIARKFNNRYGGYFPEVQPILSEMIRVMSLNDPMKKMSKSLGPKSYIALRDDAATVRSKIAKAVTDSEQNENSLGGGHNLLTLYKYFGSDHQYPQFKAQYELHTLSYAELKKALSDAIVDFLAPIEKLRRYYEDRPKLVEKILANGAKQARSRAQTTMRDVRKRIGLA